MTYDEISEKLISGSSLVRIKQKFFGNKDKVFYAVYIKKGRVNGDPAIFVNNNNCFNQGLRISSIKDILLVDLEQVASLLNDFINFEEKAQGEPCEQPHM